MRHTIVRQVRLEGGQYMLNLPVDVRRHLDLDAGDAVMLTILPSDIVVLEKVEPRKLEKNIGRKV